MGKCGKLFVETRIMLVIHPKDKTTAMLSAQYEGLEAQVVDDCPIAFYYVMHPFVPFRRRK